MFMLELMEDDTIAYALVGYGFYHYCGPHLLAMLHSVPYFDLVANTLTRLV